MLIQAKVMMKQTIKAQAEKLQAREQVARLRLDESEEQLRKKAKSVGIIALVTGVVALMAYWGYQALSAQPDQSEKKVKAPMKQANSSSRLSKLVTPFLVRFFKELLELDKED